MHINVSGCHLQSFIVSYREDPDQQVFEYGQAL